MRAESAVSELQCLLRAFLHAAQAENTVRGVLPPLLRVVNIKPHGAKAAALAAGDAAIRGAEGLGLDKIAVHAPVDHAGRKNPVTGQTYLQKARLSRQTKASATPTA